MIYRKLYMDQILSFSDTPFTKILTGVRRYGKSTILLMLQEELKNRGIKPEQILFYRFDSLRHENINTASRLYKEIEQHLCKEKRTYLFWTKCRRFRIEKSCKFFYDRL